MIGAFALLVGISSAAGSLREPIPVEAGRDRFLVAMHEAARAGFWFALAFVFIGLSLIPDPFRFRWLAMLPIGMAGLRLVAAAFLSRS